LAIMAAKIGTIFIFANNMINQVTSNHFEA
jgi:hypothetical protein